MSDADTKAREQWEAVVDKEAWRLLRSTYGYIPSEGEHVAMFRGCLLVAHPDRPPRLYKRGCDGAYSEIKL